MTTRDERMVFAADPHPLASAGDEIGGCLSKRRNRIERTMLTTGEDDGMSQIDRRTRITAQIESNTGIDEELIHQVVHVFYARVREDAVLAPIFDKHISDWAVHLEKMCTFWSSVALLTGRYHGRPMEKHLPLPVDAYHFDRWLALFEDTARQECGPAAADHFIERARRIAESLEMGIATRAGVLLGKGERYTGNDLKAQERAG